MAKKEKHRLTIIDRTQVDRDNGAPERFGRPVSHIHRYTPTCSCGWIGVHRTTEDDAAKEWRNDHVRKQATRANPKPSKSKAAHGWRPPTPRDQLPEVLR